MSHPLTAEANARALLREPGSPLDRSYAYQALGIVARERGEVALSMRMFRLGVAECDRTGDKHRRADLQASLGTALAAAGRRQQSMDVFREALREQRGVSAARVLVRRSAVHFAFGDSMSAYDDARRATTLLHRAGDVSWEARARHNAAAALLGLGRFAEADREFPAAQELFLKSGQAYAAVLALHGQADCAYRMGDVPRALALLRDSLDRYRELGALHTDAQRDLIKVLLAAGLLPEAAAAAENLVRDLRADPTAAQTRADGLGVAAAALLACGDGVRAGSLAERARAAHRRLGHQQGERSAQLVEIQARATTGQVSRRLARAALRLANTERDWHASERLDALLLAGDLCAQTGLLDEARQAWQAAAAHRRRGSALRRSAAWLAEARIAGLDGRRRRLLRACDAGLDLLDSHRLSLGSTELQAQATTHGRELAATAVRQVLHQGSGRDLLRWTERWRATVLLTPSGRPVDDSDDMHDLAALREVSLRAGQGDADVVVHERERQKLEERIRRRAHARAGTGVRPGTPTSVEEMVSSLQDNTALVAIARVDGVAHVVVARNGRVRRFQAGGGHEIDRTAEFARFALRSAATGNEATAAAMTAALEDQAARFQELLMGPSVRALGDGPVVVVPPARLQSIPWDALPVLRDRPISVSPSASSWLRSCRAIRPRRRRVALVTGPGLQSAGAEIPQLARTYERATVLGDGAATCDAAMKALDGAWLAHVAAHGTIRTDNPMFSALELDDGPLTVYDLERLRRAPYRLVLSVCESAVGAATGADELLGLSSALIGLGTAGLLASIVPVNDEATVPFSLVIHERLRAGDDLATALMHARLAAGDDPVARATAYSFLALGAA